MSIIYVTTCICIRDVYFALSFPGTKEWRIPIELFTAVKHGKIKDKKIPTKIKSVLHISKLIS